MAGWFFNLFYWYRTWQTLKTYQIQSQTSYSYEENLQFLNTTLFIQAACLLIWLITFVVETFGDWLGLDAFRIREKSSDIVWLAFAVIPFILGYFAIHQPEVFKLSEPKLTIFGTTPEPKQMPEPKTEGQNDENLQILKEKVEVFMRKNNLYSNPKLTINELALELKITPHLLSKVINDGFQMNFFDFINNYRIEAFKRKMEDPKSKNLTLLGIAFEVGFNSKTAFNRSFKKLTNQTPREYFQLMNEE